MSAPKIVFLDRATIPKHIELPRLTVEHEWQEYDFTSPEHVFERIYNADIIITNKVVLTGDVLAQLPNIKLIAVSATGVNNVDIEHCRANNIAVSNVQGYATRSVPEHVIGMMFALRRNLMGYHHDIAAGEWQRNKQFCFFTHPIGDIAGSTMGIIGGGALGRATAELAKALGMNVVFAERKGTAECRDGYLPFETVLKQADVISLHCPLSEETRNMVAEQEFAQMKPNTILINTGRGGLVDEIALVDALKKRQIAGAGVDVFTQEPADIDNPLLANMDLPNLLLTPHVAWGSDSAISQLAQILISNIEAFVAGKQQNRVV
ncbi:D-2-hydroxyacid dehydrogenase [Vibrio diazotrophicus]|uniref:D-2-hydroxyacid dehydrogenase n=1 Tax=Vibrio diazotrophicus TaxID=685 RepID=UPI0022AF1646|nr:D-2-hydroxyacid dehydrogenase [Vibrio diazotrophicus]MCZ4372300.1 D-2-hydroxyacid dehydrogenase [Vibrio diazotrophicus]